jgi:hypothetical protein
LPIILSTTPLTPLPQIATAKVGWPSINHLFSAKMYLASGKKIIAYVPRGAPLIPSIFIVS